jgi:putative transposase
MEFHAQTLIRGCRQYGIELVYRPPAHPHFGGHIERLIGTLMGEVHLLPGTTFGSVAQGGAYDSEKEAKMTLENWKSGLPGRLQASTTPSRMPL